MNLFFVALLFLRKITIMASVSKLFPSQNNRIGTKKIDYFFGNQGSDDEKVPQKITMMASVSKRSLGPKNSPGVSGLFFFKTYSGKETRIKK